MKWQIFFLVALLSLSSCQKEEEEVIDLDQMALLEVEESDRHLAGEPILSPQEQLCDESQK